MDVKLYDDGLCKVVLRETSDAAAVARIDEINDYLAAVAESYPVGETWVSPHFILGRQAVYSALMLQSDAVAFFKHFDLIDTSLTPAEKKFSDRFAHRFTSSWGHPFTEEEIRENERMWAEEASPSKEPVRMGLREQLAEAIDPYAFRPDAFLPDAEPTHMRRAIAYQTADRVAAVLADSAGRTPTYGQWQMEHIMLLDLINAIHRDGGEKTQTVGLALAYQHAMMKVRERKL